MIPRRTPPRSRRRRRRADATKNGRPAMRRAGRYRIIAACDELLQLDDVLRRRALLALHDVELDPLTLGQALEALGLDRRMVDEAVLLTVLGRDEAEALGVVEP